MIGNAKEEKQRREWNANKKEFEKGEVYQDRSPQVVLRVNGKCVRKHQEQVKLRRSSRERKPNPRYQDYE